MKRWNVWLAVWTLVGIIGPAARGGEFVLMPIVASGPHTIVGNEIRLEGGGQRVFLEVFLSDWDPDGDGVPTLRGWQATIDASGYSSGLKGTLGPAVEACATSADCEAVFGTGSLCVPGFAPVACTAGFIDTTRADYVYAGFSHLPAADTSTPNFRFGGATIIGAPTDPGVPRYGGTLVLDVPVGAIGTFTLGFIDFPATNMQDETLAFISPLFLTPALITIVCNTNADCDDASACTDDTCLGDGTCVNTPNFNQAVECCDPVTGIPTVIDDGIECTDDVCDAGTGVVTHDPLPAGAACGNPLDTECDGADSCDGFGACLSNVAPPNQACGDPSGTECDDPDTCDGLGACLVNHVAAGSPCGDGAATDCTDPDTCDGLGACLANDAPDGTVCDTEFCTLDQACQTGVCAGGTPNPCDDALACTTDACDEANDVCVSTLDAGFCLIDGVCRSDGDLNPGNDCESCDPFTTTTAWTFRPAGEACDDGDPCSGTGRPGIGIDTCDGAGVCFGLPDAECNDQCDFAVEVFEGVNTGGNDNQGPDDVEVSCQPDSNNDVWFVYTANCNGLVFVSTTGSAFLPSNDPVLSVHDACPSVGGAEIACDDDSGVDLNAALSFPGEIGVSYWFRVAGFEDNTGAIVLNVATVNDCVIDNICRADGEVNPDNECEACIPELSTSSWSSRAEGTPCGDPTDTECDSPDACDGAGVCEVNPKPDGTVCSDDGNVCTFDECLAGACSHPPVPVGEPCGDPSDSTCDHPDSCDGAAVCLDNFESAGTLCGDPSSDQCDNPNVCDGLGLCDNNFVDEGTPCDDADVCTGPDTCRTGVCVGDPIPVAPVVSQLGSRYFSVTPGPAGSVAPVSLRLTSSTWPCIVKYIALDGQLKDAPIFMLPDEWGTVFPHGTEVTPSATYSVEAECGSFRSEAGSATTALWGDTVGIFDGTEWTAPNGSVEILDLLAIVEGFVSAETAPELQRVDLWPCAPDGVIDILDLVFAIEAFQGIPFSCDPPCQP